MSRTCYRLIFKIICLFAGPVGEDWNIMPEIIFEDECQFNSHIWNINSENEIKSKTANGFDFTADRSSSQHVFTNMNLRIFSPNNYVIMF